MCVIIFMHAVVVCMHVVHVEGRKRSVVLLKRSRTFRCKMTSVDSGVETGNDSNDSSIVQHENLPPNQISNVSTTVATTTSSPREIHENEPGTFRIEFMPVWPVGLHPPISSLCPIIENYNYTGNTENATSTSSSRQVVCSSKVSEFRSPRVFTYNVPSTAKELVKSRATYGKMKSCKPSLKRHHYLTWIDAQSSLIERKMRLAAATNNTVFMRKLLSSGVSPNNHDEQGRTPLHLASCRGYTEMVRLLLEHGANPNQRDRIGNTPLHLATVTSKISVVTLLLEAGTDILSLDRQGDNLLQLAQTKLQLLQNCNGEDMLRVKEEVHNIVTMLVAYLQKQKDAVEKVETLGTLCSRLSLSNTSDQVQDDVKNLLANLDALRITS